MRRLDINTLAIIGAGKIGSAIINAVKKFDPDLVIIATVGERKHLYRPALLVQSLHVIIEEADFIVLSVKPHHFPAVLKRVGRDPWSSKIVLSVMAGIRLSTLEEVLRGAGVYRAMPNINALVGLSATAVASNINDGRGREIVENY